MVLYYGTLKYTMVLKCMYYGIYYMVLQESHATTIVQTFITVVLLRKDSWRQREMFNGDVLIEVYR